MWKAINTLRDDFRHFAYGNGDGSGGLDGRTRGLEVWVKAHERKEQEDKENRERAKRDLRSDIKDIIKVVLPVLLAMGAAHWGFNVSW